MGTHRQRACAELGVDCPTVVRALASERDKREHVRKINLLRRNLDPVTWAEQFQAMLEERGVERRRGPKRHDGIAETVSEIAAELGVHERTARNRMSLLVAPDDVKEQVRSGEMAEKEARRRTSKARRRAETAAAAQALAAHRREVPVSVFTTLVIDPPWRYDNATTRGAAEDHYPTMTVDELRKLEVPAADDAHLYLWVTNGFLREGFDLLDVWGFTYKTCLTWVKSHMGLGNWFRSVPSTSCSQSKGTCLRSATTPSTGSARHGSATPRNPSSSTT